MAGRLERITVNLPAGFDPRRHTPAVIQKITESHGPGWEVEAIDPSGKRLTAVRQVEITEAHHADADTMILGLAQGTKPSDGDKIAARFEDAHPGWFLVDFDPFVGQATMRRLTANERRAREAIATGLRVKPWDVKVKAARGGGFNVVLPRSYEPGKQDEKLQEIAESVVGKVGWYVKTDPAKLTAQIIPGERPMFEPAYTYPVDAKIDKFALPIGLTLPEPGDRHGSLEVDLDDNVGLLLQGLAGSGKSVLINGFIYAALVSGHEISVIDVPHKKADFEWMKPYVREHGWGCDSLEQTLAVVNRVYEDGEHRGRLFDEYGVKKWQDLPADVRKEVPIHTLIVDEMSGLLTKDAIPKSLPKDHPMRLEAEQNAAMKDMLTIMLTKIPAEMRAAGIRVLYATQQAQSNLSIPPSIKINIPNRILLGANQSKQQRGHAFATPEKTPWVPEYIIEDSAASRGVGVSEFEGAPPSVFKAFYASDKSFIDGLEKARVRKAKHPEPTEAMIDAVLPMMDDDDGPPPSRLSSEGGFGERDGRDAPPERLRGAAAAAHALKQQEARGTPTSM